MSTLAKKKCVPCEGTIKSLDESQAKAYLKEVPGWTLNAKADAISREYVVKNFMTAVDFITKIAAIAEETNHHPDIHLTGYRKLRVELSTHAIKGLSENDFILAARINELGLMEAKRT